MKVLSHPGLHCRDFGSSLLSVSDFREWLSANRLRIATLPSIDEYDYVQIESLLCAVERAAGAATDESEAEKIVSADSYLAENEAADFAPHWLFGAEAHRKWRIKITHAAMAGELCILDFGSKLPIKIPDAALRAAAEYGPTAKDLAAGIYAPAKKAATRITDPLAAEPIYERQARTITAPTARGQETAPRSVKDKWIERAKELAAEYVTAWRAAGYAPTVADAALYVEAVFSTDGIFNTRGESIDRETIKREALAGITGRKPGERVNGAKIPTGKRESLP